MYTVGCLYLVAPRCWRTFGRSDHQCRQCGLMRTVPGPYVTTKLCIRTHTRIIRLDSLTRTGVSIYPSRPPKPGSLAQVAGMNVHARFICCLYLTCKRICPGRHLAIRVLCLTIARILATFDILPPVDENGNPRIPEARYHNTLIR